MTAITNLFRRGAVYYYRRNIHWPDGISQRICLSLKTRRLSVARQRGARLADRCETFRRVFAMDHDNCSLSMAQRRKIFERQLVVERDALELLHCAVQRLSNNDVLPQRYSELMPDHLAAISQISEDIVRSGCPDPTEYESVEDYLHTLSPALDELERIYVLGGIGSLERLHESARQGGEDALSAIGATPSEENEDLAIRALFRAKLQAAREFRKDYVNPAGFPPTDPGDEEYFPAERMCAADPEWPPSHLLDLNQEAKASSLEPHLKMVHSKSPTAETSKQWAELTIEEAGERFLAAILRGHEGRSERRRKRDRWNADTVKQFRGTTKLATKAFPLPIVQLRHEDVERFDWYLDRLPASHHKSPRHDAMTLDEICAEADDQVRRGELNASKVGLGVSTCNRHFFFFKVLWEYVSGIFAGMAAIEWSQFHVSDRRDRRSQREAYSIDQGHRLFSLPIWTGCASVSRRFVPGALVFHDAGYWVPILIWYTGARETEICARLVSEIHIHSDVPYIEIKDNELGRVKNVTSHRIIPIPREAVRLGFLEYVEELKRRGETRLFPDLNAKKTRPADYFLKKFGRRIRQCLPDLAEGQLIHSMRHTVETQLCEAGIDRRVRNDLLGHINESEGEGRYAKVSSLVALSKAMATIPVVTASLERRVLNLQSLILRSRSPKSTQPHVTRPRLVWNSEKPT
ncbi:MAG: site-specific integrase [Sphingomonadaceae bacterium]